MLSEAKPQSSSCLFYSLQDETSPYIFSVQTAGDNFLCVVY